MCLCEEQDGFDALHIPVSIETLSSHFQQNPELLHFHTPPPLGLRLRLEMRNNANRNPNPNL